MLAYQRHRSVDEYRDIPAVMAEGGPLPADQLNKDNTALICQLLECPICLEQMLNPKSLPCLHSFCEECLGTYIVTDLSGEMAAVTSFPCPVCRQITSPVNLSESKEIWAQQFPTNSLVQEYTNRTMVSYAQRYCGFCKKTKNIETLATMLCETNGMWFCEHCKISVHDVVHEVCGNVSLNEVHHNGTWKQPSSMTCSTHQEKNDYYCEDHKFIGCNKCIITDHRRCDVVMTIREYCGNQKKKSKLDNMDKSLGNSSHCMELMINAIDDLIESMQQCQDVGLSSIVDLRQKIDVYLDKKQEEITQEMISKYKAEKSKVDLFKQKCSRLRVVIQSTKEAFMTAVRKDDNLEMIQLFVRGQTEIRACNDLIDDITHSSKSVTVKHDIDSSHITIDQSSTLTLGRIIVEEQPSIIPDGVEYIQNVDLLSNSRAKKSGTCLTKIKSNKYGNTAHGVLLMPSGNIIVSDYQHNELKLFSVKGQYLDDLKISGYPHDVCLVDDDTVAVAVSKTKIGIHVVKVQPPKLTLSTVIKVSDDIACHGLAFMDGNFMVSTSKDIHSVTMDGKVEKVHTLSSPCLHLASDLKKNKIIACLKTSTVDNIFVTRLPNGIQIYGIDERVVKQAMGVDVDREGNVYVCGKESNNVVQISSDGSKVRELLTSENGIEKPRAISVCGDKFVVTNESSKGRNEIYLYHLC